MISFSIKHTISALSLAGLLTSCSVLHQMSPVNIDDVSPDLSATVGRVEGQVARTRLYEGITSSILPDKSVETRIALYKEEQRKLETELNELAYADVKDHPNYHARTLQELSRYILEKSTTSQKNIEFVVSPELKTEFLQAAAPAHPLASDTPPELEANATPESTELAEQEVTTPPAPLDIPKLVPEGMPYGKSLDERGKAGLDVYLKHLIAITPVLSQQDNEKMLSAYASDITKCQSVTLIDTTKDISTQYKTIESIVKELELESNFVPNTLRVRKQKKELDNIINFLDAPDKFSRSS